MTAHESMNDSEPDWEALQKAGVQKFRMQIKWQTVINAGGWEGSTGWQNSYDRYFEKAAVRGIAILPFIYTRKTGSQQYYLLSETNNYNEWLQFVAKTVKRYGQAGEFWGSHPGIAQYPVDTWEVWNEPNFGVNSPGGKTPNGKTYGEFLVGTANKIRAAQKEVYPFTPQVLFGGLYEERWDPAIDVKTYLNEAAQAPGIKAAYDGLSIHPYAIGGTKEKGEPVGEPTRTYPERAAGVPSGISTAYLAQLEAKTPTEGTLGAKPLWVTEVGWPVDGAAAQHVTPTEQSNLLNDTYNWLKANWSTYNIKYAAWYFYRDSSSDPATKWDQHAGLRDAVGMFRPAWFAYESQTGAPKWPAENTYRYMLGASNGSTFGWATTNLTNMNKPWGVNVNDINGDGKADIVAVEKEASGHYVYVTGISNGATFVWSGSNLTNMNEPVAMDLGDINGDGKADIVAVEKEASGHYVYVKGISNGATFVWSGTNLTNMNEPFAMELGDINGDGKADIVAVEREASGLFVYCKGVSNGSTFAWSGTNLTGFYQPYAFGLGDITGDGKADIVVAEREASGLFTYARGISNGTTFAWAGTGLTGMYQPLGFALGDFTGDGKADIVAAEKDANGLYTYVRGISYGTGGFAWAGTNLTGMYQPQPMTLGDITGDKKADILAVEAN